MQTIVFYTISIDYLRHGNGLSPLESYLCHPGLNRSIKFSNICDMINTVVLPYDPQWILDFNRIKEYLEPGMGNNCLAIEHIGSTSIPGMTAKPIIDVDVVILPGNFEAVKSDLEDLGYVHEGDKGLKGREAFGCHKLNIDLHHHHLYVCEQGNHHLLKHLSFRNYLRERPELIKKLSEHKVDLARESGHDRKEYQRKKEMSIFVKKIADTAFQICKL